jgi:hypothetical protein
MCKTELEGVAIANVKEKLINRTCGMTWQVLFFRSRTDG